MITEEHPETFPFINVAAMLSCCKPIHRFQIPSTIISCIFPHERGIPPFWEIHNDKSLIVNMTGALSTTPRIRHIDTLYLGKPVTYLLPISVIKSKLEYDPQAQLFTTFFCSFLYWVRKKNKLFHKSYLILECVRHINLPLMKHQMYSFSFMSWFLWAVHT